MAVMMDALLEWLTDLLEYVNLVASKIRFTPKMDYIVYTRLYDC